MSDHKRFSASSLYRTLACPASLRHIESLPPKLRESKDNIHSRRGTCAHTVGEMVLQGHKNEIKPLLFAIDYLGSEVDKVIVDDKIVAGVNVYVDHLLERLPKSKLFDLECSLTLEDWSVLENNTDAVLFGDEIGGTMDCIAIVEDLLGTTLFVTDYKNGTGLVEVHDNPQLLCYALAALLEYMRKYDIDFVCIEIVQPNAYHDDGPIRHETLTAEEVLAWGQDILVPGMVTCLTEGAEFVPGDHQCHYCQGKVACKKLDVEATESAMVEFADEIDGPPTASFPEIKTLSDKQIQRLLVNETLIRGYLDAVHSYAHARATGGTATPGFKLVKKRANRKWVEDEETKIKKALKGFGLNAGQYTVPPKLMTPSQIDETLKAAGVDLKKQKSFRDTYIIKPDNGTNFVADSKPGKAIVASIESEFAEHIDDNDF